MIVASLNTKNAEIRTMSMMSLADVNEDMRRKKDVKVRRAIVATIVAEGKKIKQSVPLNASNPSDC